MSVPVLSAPFAPLPAVKEGKAQPKYRFWHETLIDLIIQHPELNTKELAVLVGKTPQSLYMVMGSDMFRARLACRRAEHSERISYVLIAKTSKIADKALTQLDEKLEDNKVQKKISARDLGEIAAEALTRIGLGPKQPDIVVNTQVNQTNTSVTVSPEALLRARSKLRQNESRLVFETGEARAAPTPSGFRGETIDSVTVIEHVSSDPARPAILDELMSIGDDAGGKEAPEGEQAGASPEQASQERAALREAGEGEG